MPPTPEARAPRRALCAAALLACGAASSCTVQLPPLHPRPPLARRYAPAPVPELVEREQLPGGAEVGVLRHDGERVRFELRRRARAADAPAPPLVLLVPILGGGRALMELVAERVRARGFDVAFCDRAGSPLTPPQRGPQLDELFRRTVLHQRMLLNWLREGASPPPCVHVLGMSLGGMITTVLAAHEPDITSVAVCLAGADLAGMILETTERRVQRWRGWREETDGVGRDALLWELRHNLSHEPARFAAQVPTEKVLFVSAAFDSVVPRRNQDLLWEGLGRPRRLDLPLGHYTAAIAVDEVIAAATDHFHAKGRP
jgi:pimeloyl-ACP methyl ester carboxylesterase